jgi:branched-subunit amino acid transport protein AzlD
MAISIFFCRFFPFLFFRKAAKDKSPKTKGRALLAFVEKTAPPAAMTALAFNAIAAPLKENYSQAISVLAASALTALLHIWKRGALLSIAGGTLLYMLLRHLYAAV